MNCGNVSEGWKKKSDFLCKSELSSDGCLVLVVCYESFNAAGRRHCDPDPFSAKLRGTQPSTFPCWERDFQARLMWVHLAPIPLALCYCLGFNNNGVAFKSLRLTALSDNHKRICVRLKTCLSATPDCTGRMELLWLSCRFMDEWFSPAWKSIKVTSKSIFTIARDA